MLQVYRGEDHRCCVSPAIQAFRIIHEADLVFLNHRHQNVLQFALPQLSFVKLGLHRLARFQIGKAAHKEEGVGIFDGKERPENFHADFVVCWDRLGTKNLEKLSAPAWLELISTHFDDHVLPRKSSLREEAGKTNQSVTIRQEK